MLIARDVCVHDVPLVALIGVCGVDCCGSSPEWVCTRGFAEVGMVVSGGLDSLVFCVSRMSDSLNELIISRPNDLV